MNTFSTGYSFAGPSGYPTGDRQPSSYTYGNRPNTNFGYDAKQTYGENFVLNARVNFIRKVFSIVSLQLITTGIFVYLSAFSKGYSRWLEHAHITTFFASCGTMISLLMLVFWRSLARSTPKNYYILGFFTLCESFLVSKITTHYDPSSIFGAIFLTAAIVSSLTLYACTTKHEITYFMGLIAMLTMGSFFLFFVKIIFHGSFIHLVSSLMGSVLAGLYLIYDIKAIMGNHGTFRVDIDDYVGGALNLYVDVIRIFLKVLHLFSEKVEKEKDREQKRRR
jgi:FtsH-binding integral membrane protein